MKGKGTADDAFFDLLRDRSVITAMVKETAGKVVADGNVSAAGSAQKQIIKDCLNGTNGRPHVADWLPGYFEFPVRGYRNGSGLTTEANWKGIKKLFVA